MRKMRLRYLSLPVLVLTMISGAPSAQEGTSSSPGGSVVVPGVRTLERRVVIDGSKNPELVPDEMVITAALRLWTLPLSSDAAAERRFRAVTARYQLAPADYGVLRRELQRAHTQLLALQATSRNPDALIRREAQRQTRAASMDVWGRIIELMTPDGRQKMRTALDNLKRNARIQTVDAR